MRCPKCKTTEKRKFTKGIWKRSRPDLCKECRRQYSKKYRKKAGTALKEKKKDYRHTPLGLAHQIYRRQIRSSKRREHPKPDYDFNTFFNWLNTHGYPEALAAWVKIGYATKATPSVDRKNSSKPYTIDNIQVMTWNENRLKRDSVVDLESDLTPEDRGDLESEKYKDRTVDGVPF